MQFKTKSCAVAAIVGALALTILSAEGRAATFDTLYSFPADDTRGLYPVGSMVQGADGALYGVTSNGGKLNKCMGGCGVVYRLTPTKAGPWRQTLIFAFSNSDGAYPNDGISIGPDGTIYGTTSYGGSLNGGTVFSLTPPAPGETKWTHTILHEFDETSPNDNTQYGKVIIGTDGALYGMNGTGGGDDGTIWRLVKKKSGWSYKALHHFGTGYDPQQGLVQDAQGRLYGTGSNGGAEDKGVLFRLSPPAEAGGNWSFHILHDFSSDAADASYPNGTLLLREGALYGQAQSNVMGEGGVIFRLTLPNTFEIIYRYKSATQGSYAGTGMAFDNKGALYGVTSTNGPGGKGTLFKLAPKAGDAWGFRLLHAFSGAPDGENPYSEPLVDKDGNVYVNTQQGGTDGHGGVFVYRP